MIKHIPSSFRATLLLTESFLLLPIFLLILLLFSPRGLHAQGTVDFRNRDPGLGIDAPISFSTGQLIGSNYKVQLYAGPAGAPVESLQPAYPVSAIRSDFPGYFFPEQVTISFLAAGQLSTLQLRAFDGATWEDSDCRGESNLLAIRVSGGSLVPAPLIGLQPFQVLCVLEPQTTLLACLGFFVLLSASTRKRCERLPQ
jgi:hypothetical protein